MHRANKRLIRESVKMKSYNKDGINFSMINNDLSKWKIILTNFDKDTKIYKELEKYSIEQVEMEMTIPKEYPFKPPFLRIVIPRFMSWQGFITDGGSFCVNLLTHKGWSPSYSIIALIVQIKVFIQNGVIDKHNLGIKYTLKEALKAFDYITRVHKWGAANTF
jgi:ubiquitin-conjugating enzyme E2 Q